MVACWDNMLDWIDNSLKKYDEICLGILQV